MIDISIPVPYSTKPQMTKNTGPLFNSSPDSFYINQKKQELERFGAGLWGHTYEAITGQLVQKSCRFLGLPVVDNIVDFALKFEEDVAIMHNGSLSAVCFCFPSGWIPADKVGMTLSEIHGPVADSRHLVLASEKLAKTMADPVLGSFRRQVWTVTANPGLSNYPLIEYNKEPQGITDLYFRMETQTTAPLGDGITSLFFVKVDVVPLTTVWDSHGSRIRASVNSMSDAVLNYKNLKQIKTVLNNVQLY